MSNAAAESYFKSNVCLTTDKKNSNTSTNIQQSSFQHNWMYPTRSLDSTPELKICELLLLSYFCCHGDLNIKLSNDLNRSSLRCITQILWWIQFWAVYSTQKLELRFSVLSVMFCMVLNTIWTNMYHCDPSLQQK